MGSIATVIAVQSFVGSTLGTYRQGGHGGIPAQCQLQNSLDGAKDRLQQYLLFANGSGDRNSYGPKELDLIRQSGMRAFPPRLPEQPIFYPVLSEAYAAKIARHWNVPASGKGYVTRFLIAEKFLDRYQVREAGGKDHLEYYR